MRGFSDEQKAEARRRYEAGEPMASIARRLCVRRQTLIAIRDREAWTVQHTAVSAQASACEAKAVRERATAQIIDMASRRVVEQAEAEGVIEATADYFARNLAAQGRFVHSLTAALQETVDAYNRDPGAIYLGIGKNHADYVNSLADAAKKIMSMGRDSAGLRLGDLSKPVSGSEVDPADQPVVGIKKEIIHRPPSFNSDKSA